MAISAGKEGSGFRVSFVPDSHLVKIAFTVLVGLTIARVFFRFLYNACFHPLKRFPGSKFAAMSHLPRHYNMFIGNSVRWTHAVHERYGPVVRIAPNLLSFTDAQAWKDIYGHKSGGRKSNRKDLSAANLQNPTPSIGTAADDSVHSRQRRIFSHAFSDQALRKQEPMFQRYVDILVKKLSQEVADSPNHKFNMVRYFNFTTFDVMGHLTFNEPLGMLENTEYVPWVSTIFGSIRAASKMSVVAEYEPFSFLLRFLIPSVVKGMIAEHNRYSDERVDRRLERDSSEPDIWSLVMKQEGEKAVSRGEMYENARLFMLAGTETTATLLSGLLYYLLETPAALTELTRELDEAFPAESEVTGDKLHSLPYLHACIEEALRIYPPVPFGLVRLTPPEGAAICGEWLPGNTRICVTHYAAYHSSRNFHAPDEFHPERFLVHNSANSENEDLKSSSSSSPFASDNLAALQPFSIGPRNCLGKNMAYFEMRLIIARLLLNFEFELCEESKAWVEKQSIYALWQKGDLLCTLKPRVRA